MRMTDEIKAGNCQMQLEVRDARIPLSSRNPYFQIYDTIPKVIVYNKSDLTSDAEGDDVRGLMFYQFYADYLADSVASFANSCVLHKC